MAFLPGFAGNLAEQVVRSRRRCASPRWMRPGSPCMCSRRPVPAPICSTAPKASRLRATSTTCWPKRSPPIPIGSPASRICRCEVRKPRRTSLNGRCAIIGFCGALINGLTEGRFLDDPRFEPILARAEQLDVPIYLHPNLPPRSVLEAYYSGLPGSNGLSSLDGGVGLALRNRHSRAPARPLRRARPPSQSSSSSSDIWARGLRRCWCGPTRS